MYLPPWVWRVIGTYELLLRATVVVLAGLVLWLLVAMIRKPPAGDALRLYGPVVLWVGSPAVLGWAILLLAPYSVYMTGLGFWLYTDVYAALLIGNRLRLLKVSANRTTTPNILSLRLPALVACVLVGLVLIAYIDNGLGVPPGQWPVITFYALLACAVIAAGYFLTVDHVATITAILTIKPLRAADFLSPLSKIFPGDSMGEISEQIQARTVQQTSGPTSRITASKPKSETAIAPKTCSSPTDSSTEPIKTEVTPMASTDQADVGTSAVAALETEIELQNAALPVPAAEIPPSSAPQGIVLKLKRSQRSSLTGKVMFVLDARIELSSADVGLIRKYRLGDDVVYESTSRKQSMEASRKHLQMSEPSKTGGAGKTLFRLARAGISATAAALSLRITINSLMTGVHVECKSMGELMQAESAIIEAVTDVRDYLDVAETFDGREEILEF